MELEQLDRFKKYGEFILEKLDSVPQYPSKQEDWIPTSLDDCLVRIREAAEKTVELATSPVKIGVMGEFSSGKTLLLGSLIGYADALPISENPTTGNVTAIHIVPQPGFVTTQANNFTVEYLSHQGVNDCLQFMLQEANRQSKAAGLPSIPPSTLNTGKDIKDIINWCEDTWNNTKNLELRYLLRELVLFIRAYQAYGEAMCGGSYQIDGVTAREGLQLAEQPMAIQTLRFEDLPPSHIRLPSPPQRLPTKLLQNTFPLIRRVDIQVKISREIWDFTGASEFILLDFPGLGASNSGARDTFLSLRELAEVQTILILLNGKTPGSDRANKIFTMMQQQRPGQDLKDLILVGVGRFDQLPLDSEGCERELDQLIATIPPLDEDEVFRKLKVLQTTIDAASAFTTQPERIVLLSPLLGLAELAKRSSSFKAGSPEFLANLDYPDYLKRSRRLQQKWQLLSTRLLESDPRSHLGRQLSYFAQDGGIAKLRELIQNHVISHGLTQLYQDTGRSVDNLLQHQQHLKNIISEIHDQGIPTAEPQNLIELRAAIENLDKTYRNFQKSLGKEPLKDRRGYVVSDVVKDELTFKILNWNEWTLLFNKANNGNITIAEFKGAAGKLFDRGNRVNSTLPTKSEDFYPAFAKTVKELENFARDRIHQAVADLLSQLCHHIAPERDYLQANLHPAMEQEIETKFGVEEADIFYKLLLGCDPNKWKEAIILEINSKEQSISPENMFPLARKDEKHNIGQIFDWSPEKSQDLPKTGNHQLFVLRLRDEITACTSLHLVQYVSEINQQVNAELEGILDQIIPTLQNLSKKEALLRHLAAGDSSAKVPIPTWLQILSNVATTSYAEGNFTA